MKRIWIILAIVLTLSPIISSCCLIDDEEDDQKDELNCSTAGGHGLFVAKFDDDDIGSVPPSTGPLLYGPPGASLNITAASGVEVYDSKCLNSKALRLVRGDQIEVKAIAGTIEDLPTNGIYSIKFRACGEKIPEHYISGTSVFVWSSDNHAACHLRLYDGAYHLVEGDTTTRIDGSYDPSVEHTVHIKINLDSGKYGVCINDQVVVEYRPFINSEFNDCHSLGFFIGAMITEGFENIIVLDDIRITH